MAKTEDILERLKQCVLKGDDQGAVIAANDAAAAGLDPDKAIMEGLVAGMGEAGALYEQGEYYVPELMVSSEALYAGLAILQPLVLSKGKSTKKGVVIIGAVQGDSGLAYAPGPRTMSTQHATRPRSHTSASRGRSLTGKRLFGFAATNAGATSSTPAVLLPHQRIQLTPS